MRLEDSKHFNAEEFIKNLKKWRRDKEKYLSLLDEIPELPSISNDSGVRSSEISDPTARQAIKRMEIESEIEDIERCEEAYEYAMNKLEESERELMRAFFEPKKPIWREVEEYTQKHYISPMTMYNQRLKVLKKFAQIIEKKYL